MSTLGCSEVRGLAPEFALETLVGAERAEMLAHTERCAACRTFVGELSEAADALTLLVPEAEPPAGFSTGTLAVLGVERARARGRRGVRRWLGIAAAAAALVGATAAVSVAAARVTDHGPSARVTVSGTGDVQAAAMIGAGGRNAGEAFAYGGDHPWVFVTVDYWNLPAGTYGVEVATADGRRQSVGAVQVDGRGQGQWGGGAPAVRSGLRAIRIVDANGNPLCQARFGAGGPAFRAAVSSS